MAWEHNPVGWFEIPVVNMERAAEFYADVFEIKLQPQRMGYARMAMFPQNAGAIGSSGSLVEADSCRPSRDGVLIYFTETDIEGALARVEEAGGEVLTPRSSIGEYGWVGIFLDSEGNRIGLHSRR